MKKTVRSLMISGLSLLLCFAMLAGTTFAWFTDTVSSSGNMIVAGNLDIEMYWTDDLENGNWIDAEDATADPVFNYDKWEPGYTEVRYVKIVNAGNLSLKYGLTIIPDGEVSILADVIDVYFVENPSQNIAGRQDLAALSSVGTLRQAILGSIPATGVLLPDGEQSNKYYDGEVVVAIALKMKEEAGNEYMGKSIGDSFSLRLDATQFDYEEDAFGNEYDSNVTLPDLVIDTNASVQVTPDANGKVPAGGAVIDGDEASAVIPEGVLMENGAKSLTLEVANMEESYANLLYSGSDRLTSLNVHIKGVSESNTVPMSITIKEATAKGLNFTSIELFHVENNQTIPMVLVALDQPFTAHNQFKYDPATGDITLNMASFSEVAMLANAVNRWEGGRDYSWYTANPDADTFSIANADQLAALSGIVGGMKVVTGRNADTGTYTYDDNVIQDSFKGKTINLVCDINIGDTTDEDGRANLVFYPIGYYNSEGTYEKTGNAISSGFRNFEGTFNGRGNTISNFYQNTWEMKGDDEYYAASEQRYRDGMGLFGRVYGGNIRNLNVDGFKSDGEYTTTGVIAAYADFGAKFENISIFNCNPRVYNIGNGGIVGCVGWYTNAVTDNPVEFTNITVDNSNKISALWGSWDVACGGIVGQYYPTSGQSSAGNPKNAGILMTNCHVGAQIDVYNDVCANYQYYAYRYAGMLIGSVRENVSENGHEYPKMDGINFNNCTVHFGDWNDYYYCELVANSLASYTHDHQMSRLEQIEEIDLVKMEYRPLKSNEWKAIPASGRYNFVVVKKNNDGTWNHGDGEAHATCYHFVNGAQHKHDVADSDNPNIYETVNGEQVLKEDKQCIYREFNNLVTGYGWGVTSKGLGSVEGVTKLDETTNSPEAAEKFVVQQNIPAQENGVAIQIGELFSTDDTSRFPIRPASIYVGVTVLEGNLTANFTRSKTDDWSEGLLTFNGTGRVRVTIQDYYYCKPASVELTVVEPKINYLVSGQELYEKVRADGANSVGAVLSVGINKNATKLVEDEGYGYVRVVSSTTAEKTNEEAYFYLLHDNTTQETGKYVIMKYRIPERVDPNYNFSSLEIYTSCVDKKAENNSETRVNDFAYNTTKLDGEWRIMVFDLSAKEVFDDNFTGMDVNGRYYSNFIRIDLLNHVPAGQTIDIEFIGMSNDLEEIRRDIDKIQKENAEKYPNYTAVKDISFIASSSSPTYIPVNNDFNVVEESKKYISDSANIAEGIEYVACIDYVSTNGSDSDSVFPSTYTISTTKISEVNFNRPVANKLYINGWTVMEGGVNSYWWSADDGKTWTEITNTKADSSGAMMSTAENQHYGDYKFNQSTDHKNGAFQANHILRIDFAGKGYSGVHNIIIAAKPNNSDKYCVLTIINRVNIMGTGCENYVDVNRFIHSDSVYIGTNKEYVSTIEAILGKSPVNNGTVGKDILSGNSVSETGISRIVYDGEKYGQIDYTASLKSVNNITLQGWTMVESGVEKYVWSYDGKTWYDVKPTNVYLADDTVITSASGTAGINYTKNDAVNGRYSTIDFDFADLIKEYPYLDNREINITIAAVPINDADTNDGKTELAIIYRLLKFRICKPTETPKCENGIHATDERVEKYGYNKDTQSAEIQTCCKNCGAVISSTTPKYVMHFDNFGNKSLSFKLTPDNKVYDALTTDPSGKAIMYGWAGMQDRISKLKYRVVDSSGNKSEWTSFGNIYQSNTDAVINAIAGFGITNKYECYGYNVGMNGESIAIDLSTWLKKTTDSVTLEIAFVSTGALQDGLTGDQALVHVGTFTNVKLGCSGDNHKMLDSNYIVNDDGYIEKIIGACVCGITNNIDETFAPKYVMHFDYFGKDAVSSGIKFSNVTGDKYLTETNKAFTTNSNGKMYAYGWAGIEGVVNNDVDDGGFNGIKYRVLDSNGTILLDWQSVRDVSSTTNATDASASILSTHGITCIAHRFSNAGRSDEIDLSKLQLDTDRTVTVQFAFVYIDAYDDLGEDALIYAGEFTNVTIPAKIAQ